MAWSDEQMKFVQTNIQTIGYLLANYKKFGNDALTVAKDYCYNMGKLNGQRIKQMMGITGSDVNAIAAVWKVVLEQNFGIKAKEGLRVEGNKVIGENKGFCPMMVAVDITKAPWETMCSSLSWPMMAGMAAAVNPNAKMEVPESRCWGNNRCLHVVTVP